MFNKNCYSFKSKCVYKIRYGVNSGCRIKKNMLYEIYISVHHKIISISMIYHIYKINGFYLNTISRILIE